MMLSRAEIGTRRSVLLLLQTMTRFARVGTSIIMIIIIIPLSTRRHPARVRGIYYYTYYNLISFF